MVLQKILEITIFYSFHIEITVFGNFPIKITLNQINILQEIGQKFELSLCFMEILKFNKKFAINFYLGFSNYKKITNL